MHLGCSGDVIRDAGRQCFPGIPGTSRYTRALPLDVPKLVTVVAFDNLGDYFSQRPISSDLNRHEGNYTMPGTKVSLSYRYLTWRQRLIASPLNSRPSSSSLPELSPMQSSFSSTLASPGPCPDPSWPKSPHLRHFKSGFREEVPWLGHERDLDGHWSSNGRGAGNRRRGQCGGDCGALGGVSGSDVACRMLSKTPRIGCERFWRVS